MDCSKWDRLTGITIITIIIITIIEKIIITTIIGVGEGLTVGTVMSIEALLLYVFLKVLCMYTSRCIDPKDRTCSSVESLCLFCIMSRILKLAGPMRPLCYRTRGGMIRRRG